MPENIILDATDSSEKVLKVGFKMESAQAQQLAYELSTFADRIDHDVSVGKYDLLDLDIAVAALEINIWGDIMSVSEAERIPDLEMNDKIFEEIVEGKMENISRITFLPRQVAEYLIHNDFMDSVIKFADLEELTDGAAEVLSKYKGSLYFPSLTYLSEKAAEYFGNHEGVLMLDGLTTISDKKAESLSRHKGGVSFDMLFDLSGGAAEHLSKLTNFLSLENLRLISDEAAEHLGNFQGIYIKMTSLFSFSEAAAKSLSRLDEDSLELNEEAANRVNKYRKK